MVAAAGSGLDQSPSHRKRTRAQRSFTADDAQVLAIHKLLIRTRLVCVTELPL
jgi:hypothetical protein